jgi:hypothetical protein
MTNATFWNFMPCGSCKTDVLEERIASIIRVTRIGALDVSKNYHTKHGSLSHGVKPQTAAFFIVTAQT